MTVKNVNENGEKLYKRVDFQDEENNFSIETLDEMKEWLCDFWENNPDDDMDDEDIEKLCEEIRASDENELYDRLGGIDYGFYELDEDGKEIIYQLSKLTTNLCWWHSVTTEEIEEKTLQVTLTRKEEDKNPQVFTVPFEDEEHWRIIHKEQVALLLKEVKSLNREPEIKIIG